MKKVAILAGLLAIVGMSVPVLAETETPAEACAKKRSAVDEAVKSKEAIEAEIKGINDQVKELQKQIKDLRAQSVVKKRERAAAIKKVNIAKAQTKKPCAKVARCENAKKKVVTLKTKIDPKKEKLKKIREEIRERKKNASKLQEESERLEAQYNELGCRTLVAGETDQATIDKCTDVFTKWNALQKKINDLNASIINLRARYRKVMARMKALRNELRVLSRSVRANCAVGGPEAKEVEVLETDQKEFDAMDGEIKEVDVKIKKARKVKLVKPKVVIKVKAKGKTTVKVKGDAKGKTTVKVKGDAKGKTTVKVKGDAKGKTTVKIKGSASGDVKVGN
jgi:peptidoglycan hydrolase CwlO-like protein